MLGYNQPHNNNWPYVIGSIICHGIIVGLVFGVILYQHHHVANLNFNISNLGAIHVNVASNVPASKPNIIKPKIKAINNPKSKILIQVKQQNNQAAKPKSIQQKDIGSGGKSNSGSTVIPVIKNNNLINYKAPVYPRTALQRREQGTVVVRLLVDKHNQIIDNKLYKSSGYYLLDNAVLEIMKYWSMKQAINQTAWLQIEVNFMIK